MLKKRFVYVNNDSLLEISSAHNFGACANVPCLSCVFCLHMYDDAMFEFFQNVYLYISIILKNPSNYVK